MSSTDESTFNTRNIPHAQSTDEEIVAFLKCTHFMTQAEMLTHLAPVDSTKLEKIAKVHPSTMNTIYDLLLLRESTDLQDEENVQKTDSDVNAPSLYMTPKTPYNVWGREVLRFTRLDLSAACKISAIIRGKYAEVKHHEILDMIRKLEQMATSPEFPVQEQNLSLALLKIAAQSEPTPLWCAIHICSILKQKNYPAAESTLRECFTKLNTAEAETAVAASIKAKQERHSWILRVFLSVYPQATITLFRKVRPEIVECIALGELEAAVSLLKPFYMYSTDEMEKEVFADLGVDSSCLVEACKEHIWS
ncbi:hypothetical protein NEDG_00922 [Nematocida displodere]|uniref:Uncharacterized protein n=1 Tax=Nematocida displodere TaxID=1805483 RepID=A0A177EA23_9MICR|nr:hypothetical protein NEDG_00922 [Nematocida displodere]